MINDGRRAKGLIHLCIPSIFSVPAALGDRFLWFLFILSLPTTLTVRLLFANERQKYDRTFSLFLPKQIVRFDGRKPTKKISWKIFLFPIFFLIILFKWGQDKALCIVTRPCVSRQGLVYHNEAMCIKTRPCVSLVTSRGRSGAMSASAASLLVASLSWRRMPADLSLLILLKERQSQTRQQKLGSKISIVILTKLYSPGELEKGSNE